jgi:hypothetical protein
MPQLRSPQIRWNTAFTNIITVQYPVDNWMAYSKPRDGYVARMAMSGVEDALWIGTDYMLDCEIRYVPTTNTASATGWDGVNGWRSFLEWSQLKNTFRWYPDSASGAYIDSYLVEPMDRPDMRIEPSDLSRSFRFVIRNPIAPYEGY